MENTFYSEKGKVLGFCKGYSMSFHRVRKRDGKWTWQCTNRRCGGTATSTNQEDLAEENAHHGHLPNIELIEVRKRVSNAVSAAESNRDTPAKSIVDEAFQGLSGELLLTMPAREALRARLTRHRNKNLGAVNRGKNSTEWPDSVKQTKDGRQFLYYDSAADRYFGPPLLPGYIGPAPPPRFLIFTTSNLLRSLQQSHHWAMDGTFFTAPKDYKQMYVIGYNSSNVDGTSSFFPCVYMLLQSKKEGAYREAFSKVFQQFSAHNHPISVMMDFETAVKNAILSLFPDVAVKHCLFHFYQCVYKRVQKEKIKALWTILDVKIVLRCLPSLAFLPIDETEDGFNQLYAAKDDLIRRQTIPVDSAEQVNKLFAYFERNFVRRPNGNDAIYPASLWNMNDRARIGLPRTNNGVENWNGQLNSYFRHSSPPLAEVILKLQNDEEKTRQNIEIRARNPVPRATGGMRSQKAIFSGRHIQELTTSYASGTGLPRLEFLVSIAAHLEKYHGD